jgi:L-ascorbate metabolism protein UlaG (beta-lactamase superfamily)
VDLSGSAPASRITFVGHSTLLIEDRGVRLLTDPILRDRIGPLVRARSQRERAHALVRSAGDPDAVLISHVHRDHFDVPSLRSLGSGTRLVVPRGAARLARRRGFTRVEEVGEGETTQVGDVAVTAVPADHGGARNLVGPSVSTLGYLIAGGARVYYAGDTDLFDEMSDLAPGLDVALLPVWGWGTNVGSGHLDPASAAEALRVLQPRVAIPIHWGSIRLAGRARAMRRHLTDPPREFAARAAEVAPDVEVRVLAPGESLGL